jgi:hypothetical protein
MRNLQGKEIKESTFKRMKGHEVGLEWLDTDEHAMREPIVIEVPDGLGMKMPPKDLTVDDIAELVGGDTPLDVIGIQSTSSLTPVLTFSGFITDVATQAASPGWTLGKWTEYFNSEPSTREKIWNVISLEISGTKLADKVLPPRLVRELDWVEKFWPSSKRGKGQVYPKVQLYCLMGVATAWTVS